MLIFITGYMGAGKTILGKSLADKLNYRFCDLDELIEKTYGLTIETIFEKYGEAYFREIERESLISLFKDYETVIATGGGTACYLDNMDLMNKAGITVFLDTPVEKIIKRLAGQADHRPLFKNIEPGNLPAFIHKHLESRRRYYDKASIRVEDGGSKLYLTLYPLIFNNNERSRLS